MTGWRAHSRDAFRLSGLTLLTLLCAGFHPWSEDGGLYAAGVEWLLQPTLFPHDQLWVTAHLRYSLFAPMVAALVHKTGCSLAAALLGLDVLGIAFELYAGLRLGRQLFQGPVAQWAGVGLLAAWWTMPVAGTSLLLNDPYVTARSLSTPLSLLAVSFALDDSVGAALLVRLAMALGLAALFHPLMAGYAAVLVACISIEKHVWSDRKRWQLWSALAGLALGLCVIVQLRAPAESPAVVAAAASRYYWFLSQWQWFEWMGLVGPLLVMAAGLRWASKHANPSGRALLRAAIGSGLLAMLIALLFAQEHFAAHPVARLQPLRCFLMIYALLPLGIGGWLGQLASNPGRQRNLRLTALPVGVALMAGVFFAVQRSMYAPSAHLEWPGAGMRNPWGEAFLWSAQHTPPDALFALDAKYVNEDGEGALVFRAVARRDQLSDYSKDGGEAAITPSLASKWQVGAEASRGLSDLPDAEREHRLRPLGVSWVVLHSSAVTALSCPYRNETVKVCQL